MNTLKRMSYFVMAVLVAVLSTGFSLYQMSCKKSCPSGIYLQNPHESGMACNMKKADDDLHLGEEESKSCCSKPDDSSEKGDENEKDCCDIKEVLFKKDFDFASSALEISFLKDFDFSEPSIGSDEMLVDASSFVAPPYRGPPEKQLPSGKQIRINLKSLLFDFPA